MKFSFVRLIRQTDFFYNYDFSIMQDQHGEEAYPEEADLERQFQQRFSIKLQPLGADPIEGINVMQFDDNID